MDPSAVWTIKERTSGSGTLANFETEFGSIMRKLRHASAAFVSAWLLTGSNGSINLNAAPPERPTLNHTCDPRPNILPDWIYNHHVPYRQRHNRPTYHAGKLMYHISPTSQEAMAWEENLECGKYDGHHNPPLVKGYFYPKPWESLNTGPRPNTISRPASQSVLDYGTPPINLPDSGRVDLVPSLPLEAPPTLDPIDAGRSSRQNAAAPEPEIPQRDVIPQP